MNEKLLGPFSFAGSHVGSREKDYKFVIMDRIEKNTNEDIDRTTHRQNIDAKGMKMHVKG